LAIVGFIFTVHFFNTHLRPEKFPMDTVIFTGRMSPRLRASIDAVAYAVVLPLLVWLAWMLVQYLVIGYTRDERTGQMRHQNGINAEALHQSTDAAMSMIESMQARTELMIRLYAEALKQAYAGVLDLIVRHQDKPREVRIGGKVLTVDPAAFKERYGLRVKVGSGNASKERKRADLEYIFAKQGQAVQVGMSTNQHIYNTLSDMVALTTQKDVGRYFLDPASPEAQQMAAQKEAPPEDSFVQAEKIKLQADLTKAAQKDKFDREARDVTHTEKMTDLSLKYGVPLPGSAI
jgi:hypothetical protein